MRYTRDKHVLLTVYFLFYFLVFLFFAIDYRLLAQVRPVIFWYNRDLAELTLIGLGLPRWMIAHPAIFAVTDLLAFLLPVPLLIYVLRKGKFSLALGWVFTAFLFLYLLVADIFWQVHFGPFILYVLLSFAFLTNDQKRFYQIVSGCRYYFLYIFVSAAIWKLARGAVFHTGEMSRILLAQHSYLLNGDCNTLTCRMYGWLISHNIAAQTLYIASTALEASFLIGYFTRRYDRLLILLAIVFVAADLLVMRIPYWTLLLGLVTLWIDTGVRQPAIIVYETTHHENLPALLDCCETRFPRVIVFLKELSWQNLSGQDSPSQRWPKTEFIRQPAGAPNRPFIHKLFSFLRRHRCSHLHLSTLDNNLLVFALRIGMAGNVHVSLTVHEVNGYFPQPGRSIRDLSESLAKLILHRRIGHYTFFLPAMATRFKQAMPGAITVFIPSRFYVSAVPRPAGSPFTIVIPGSVDANRRDYEAVAAFFESWCPPHPLRLVLLGDSDSSYGNAIVARLQRIRSENFLPVHYKGYVPETIYEEQLRAADLLWSPLRVEKTGSRNEPETYGQTTASGLTADLLLNNIPALTPAGFVLPSPFDKALLPYSTPADIDVLLDQLPGDGDRLYRLRQDIDAAFSFFVKENFYAAFARLTGLDEPGEEE